MSQEQGRCKYSGCGKEPEEHKYCEEHRAQRRKRYLKRKQLDGGPVRKKRWVPSRTKYVRRDKLTSTTPLGMTGDTTRQNFVPFTRFYSGMTGDGPNQQFGVTCRQCNTMYTGHRWTDPSGPFHLRYDPVSRTPVGILLPCKACKKKKDQKDEDEDEDENEKQSQPNCACALCHKQFASEQSLQRHKTTTQHLSKEAALHALKERAYYGPDSLGETACHVEMGDWVICVGPGCGFACAPANLPYHFYLKHGSLQEVMQEKQRKRGHTNQELHPSQFSWHAEEFRSECKRCKANDNNGGGPK